MMRLTPIQEHGGFPSSITGHRYNQKHTEKGLPMSDRKAATVATQAAISKNSKQTKGENESKRPDFTGTYYLFQQIDKVYRPNEYIFTRIHKDIYISCGIVCAALFLFDLVYPRIDLDMDMVSAFPTGSDLLELMVAFPAFQVALTLAVMFDSGKERVKGSLKTIANLSLYTAMFTSAFIGAEALDVWNKWKVKGILLAIAVFCASCELAHASNIPNAEFSEENEEWKITLRKWKKIYSDESEDIDKIKHPRNPLFVIVFCCEAITMIPTYAAFASSPGTTLWWKIGLPIFLLVVTGVLSRFFLAPYLNEADTLIALSDYVENQDNTKAGSWQIRLIETIILYSAIFLALYSHPTVPQLYCCTASFVLHCFFVLPLFINKCFRRIREWQIPKWTLEQGRRYLLEKDLKGMRKEIDYLEAQWNSESSESVEEPS